MHEHEHISSLADYIKSEKTVTDYTVGGKCSECGACCSDLLPLTKSDIKRVRQYMKRHHVTLTPPRADVDLTCPFLSEDKHCKVYEARPTICRIFMCNKKPHWSAGHKRREQDVIRLSMREVFGNDRRNSEIVEYINLLVLSLGKPMPF